MLLPFSDGRFHVSEEGVLGAEFEANTQPSD